MILDTPRLRYEMAIRGVDCQTLARAAGLSKNTVTNALHRRAVTSGTLRRISAALLTFPALRLGEDLVARPEAQVPQEPRPEREGPSARGRPSASASRPRGRPTR